MFLYETYPADLYLVERLECWNWVARVLETIWIFKRTGDWRERDYIHLLKAGNHVSEWSPPAADEAGSYPPFCFCWFVCTAPPSFSSSFLLPSCVCSRQWKWNYPFVHCCCCYPQRYILIHRLAVILIPKKQLLQMRLANLEKCWSDDFQPKDE